MKTEPYSSQRAEELFKTYADSDDPNEIGPEGFEQLCNDANMPMDGARPIILAWQFGAKEMAKISKEEWTSGTSTLRCVVCVFCSTLCGPNSLLQIKNIKHSIAYLGHIRTGEFAYLRQTCCQIRS
jgi:hypothetical protein